MTKRMTATTHAAIEMARLFCAAEVHGNTAAFKSAIVEMLSCGGYDDPNERFEEILREAYAAAGLDWESRPVHEDEFAITEDMIYDGSEMTGPDGYRRYRVYLDGGTWWAMAEEGSDLHALGPNRKAAARYLTKKGFSH